MKFILLVALISCLAVAALADNSGVGAGTSNAIAPPSVTPKVESGANPADKQGGTINLILKACSLHSMLKVLF
jgi:hypothetical protein